MSFHLVEGQLLAAVVVLRTDRRASGRGRSSKIRCKGGCCRARGVWGLGSRARALD